MTDYLDTVVQGDCLEVLRELPDCDESAQQQGPPPKPRPTKVVKGI